MKSHELLRAVFKDSSPKQVADDMGLSLSMIYKWAEETGETGSGAINPLDRMEQLVNSTEDKRLPEWIAERAGGFFIQNPAERWPHPYSLIPATNQILQDFADLLAVVAHAASDNHITPAEAKKIRARWQDLKSVTEGFVACCEEGNFSKMKEQLKEVEEKHR
jgi:transposase